MFDGLAKKDVHNITSYKERRDWMQLANQMGSQRGADMNKRKAGPLVKKDATGEVLVSAGQAANLLKVGNSTVYTLLKDGRLKGNQDKNGKKAYHIQMSSIKAYKEAEALQRKADNLTERRVIKDKKLKRIQDREMRQELNSSGLTLASGEPRPGLAARCTKCQVPKPVRWITESGVCTECRKLEEQLVPPESPESPELSEPIIETIECKECHEQRSPELMDALGICFICLDEVTKPSAECQHYLLTGHAPDTCMKVPQFRPYVEQLEESVSEVQKQKGVATLGAIEQVIPMVVTKMESSEKFVEELTESAKAASEAIGLRMSDAQVTEMLSKSSAHIKLEVHKEIMGLRAEMEVELSKIGRAVNELHMEIKRIPSIVQEMQGKDVKEVEIPKDFGIKSHGKKDLLQAIATSFEAQAMMIRALGNLAD